MRIQGETKCGRTFFVTADTLDAGVQLLKDWAKNPELGFGTGGMMKQPATLEFMAFRDAGPVPCHVPEVDLAPGALKKH